MPYSPDDKTWECDFCQSTLQEKTIPDLKKHGSEIFFCTRCVAEYISFKGGKRTSISLYTKIGHRHFRWTYNGPKTVAQLWFISEPGIPGLKKNQGLQNIKSFNVNDGDVIPDVTVSNVNEKLKTYLIFL